MLLKDLMKLIKTEEDMSKNDALVTKELGFGICPMLEDGKEYPGYTEYRSDNVEDYGVGTDWNGDDEYTINYEWEYTVEFIFKVMNNHLLVIESIMEDKHYNNEYLINLNEDVCVLSKLLRDEINTLDSIFEERAIDDAIMTRREYRGH